MLRHQLTLVMIVIAPQIQTRTHFQAQFPVSNFATQACWMDLKHSKGFWALEPLTWLVHCYRVFGLKS